jgi:ubiquinone/menaquinone biosynthesis C-methylase UbiE
MPDLPLLFRVTWTALRAGSTSAFYNRIAPIYEQVFIDHMTHVENVTALLSRTYPQRQNKRVLDLGCGTGLLSKALSKQGFQVLGLDISSQSLLLLHQSNPNLFVMQADIGCIPFRHGSFPVVVCLGVWRHVTHPKHVLNEICRVLAPDGVFIVGYFPPKLGGLLYVHHGAINNVLSSLYRLLVRCLGYEDQVDIQTDEQSWELMREQFHDVRKLDSGQHWYFILAEHPKTKPEVSA